MGRAGLGHESFSRQYPTPHAKSCGMESFILTPLLPGSGLNPDSHSKKFSLGRCAIQPSALLLAWGLHLPGDDFHHLLQHHCPSSEHPPSAFPSLSPSSYFLRCSDDPSQMLSCHHLSSAQMAWPLLFVWYKAHLSAAMLSLFPDKTMLNIRAGIEPCEIPLETA